MEFITTTTPSGIVRQDIFSDNFKTNIISFTFFIPLTKEDASNCALLCSVLKRGNATYGEMDKISAFLEKNYGASYSISTSKAGEMQELTVSVRFLDDRFAIDGESVSGSMMDLINATLFDPLLVGDGFKPEFVTQEKQNLKDKINSLLNDKRVYSLEKCKRVMFENEAYGIYEHGDIEQLNKITPASLYAFFVNVVKNAKLFVSYAGSKCDTAALFDKIICKLGNAQRVLPQTVINNNVTSVKYRTETLDVAQSKLNIGFRLGEMAKKDPFAFKMFNVIFGTSPTSKLFMNVREKLSLCYYCASAADSIKNVMFVYSGIETENYQKALDEILAQLDNMKNGDITKEEFENARAYLVDSYVQAADSLGSMINIQTSAVVNGHGFTRDEQIEEINKVTVERVIEIAKQIKTDTVYLLKGVGGDSDEQ